MLLSLTDIISMAALLSVSPAVREAATAQARGDIKGTVCLQASVSLLSLSVICCGPEYIKKHFFLLFETTFSKELSKICYYYSVVT